MGSMEKGPKRPILTIPLTEVIRAGAHASSVDPAAPSFSAGLKLPSLPMTRDRFRNSNPGAASRLPETSFLPPLVEARPYSSSSRYSSHDEADEVDETMEKIQGFLNRRNISKSKLDTEIHSRISKAYQTMETLEKGVKTFDDTLKLAKGRVAASAGARAKLSASTLSGQMGLGGIIHPLKAVVERKEKKPLKHVDVTRAVRPMFGLDSMKIIAESETEESGSGDEGSEVEVDYLEAMTRPESKKGARGNAASMLLEMPAAIDKGFLNKHYKREQKLSKELSGMKSKLEVLNLRTEREAGKSKTKRARNTISERPKNLTRLMAYDPKKGPAKELTDFLQSNGGSTGGWDHEDHSIFMNSYIRWKHRPSQVVANVSKQCPGRRLEEIASHLTWFEKYDTLNKANKAYVRNWQISKRRERETMFQMAKQDQRAKLEGHRSRQEMVKARREEEKERERVQLETWKKSVAEKKLTQAKAEPASPARTQKLQEGIKGTKERLLSLLPPNHKIHKLLPKDKKGGSSKPELSAKPSKLNTIPELESPPASPAKSHSSGIFSDQEVLSDFDELAVGDGELSMSSYGFRLPPYQESNSSSAGVSGGSEVGGGDAGPSRVRFQEIKKKLSKTDIFANDLLNAVGIHRRRGASKKAIASYQAKDAEMVEAKRQAILHKQEKQRNKSYLSSNEAKERIGKIETPSQLLSLTKGWKMRNNLRQLDILESAGRAAKLTDKDEYHNAPRVPSPRMFQPGPNISRIPKLGAKAWRQY